MKISNKNPNPLILTDPKGYDREIQNLQILLRDQIGWITKSFGRGWEIASESTQNRREPFAYMGGQEYYSLKPNDSLGAHSFFIPIGDEIVQDYKWGTNSVLYNRRTALIIWGNLNKVIQKNAEYDLSHLKLEIINQLKKKRSITGLDVIKDQKINDIFAPFDVDIYDRALYHPFFGLRFEFDMEYHDSEC